MSTDTQVSPDHHSTMANITTVNYTALARPLSQRSSKSFVGEVGRRQTDRYSLWRSKPITRGQARARHSSLQQPTEGVMARHAGGGETTPGWTVTRSKSHHVCSTVGTRGWDSVSSPTLCRTLPGLPADEAREVSGLLSFSFWNKNSLLSSLSAKHHTSLPFLIAMAI